MDLSNLRRPRHVVPLIARDRGVEEKQGDTEAAVEFYRLKVLKSHIVVIGEFFGRFEVGSEVTQMGQQR